MLPGLKAVLEYGEGRAAFWAAPPRGDCAVEGCPEKDAILYTRKDGLVVCAHHYRVQTGGARPYPCDICESEPAFRDASNRRNEWLCADCHLKVNGYEPSERSRVSQALKRESKPHSMGRKEKCTIGNDACRGQVKPRGKLGVLCDFHTDPKKYLARKGE